MNFAVILSGGIGTRMRTNGFPKQYIEVGDKPILIYTMETFEKSSKIDKIIVVAAKEWQDQIHKWKEEYNITKLQVVANAGESRQDSILNGLEACIPFAQNDKDKVIIHDAVRPLVSEQLIASCMDALNEHDGCMPVLPLNDTVYMSENGTEISRLLDRSTLFAGQAPESFLFSPYLVINQKASRDELNSTSGSSVIAYENGMDVCLIPGEDMNFKITTPADLNRFTTIIGESSESI